MKKKNIKIIQFFSLIIMFFAYACQVKNSQENTTQNELSIPNDTLDKSYIKPKYAQNFRVEFFKNYKKLSVFLPAANRVDSLTYILVKKGEILPKGFKKEQIIEIPIKSLIPMSHTYIACTNLLGLSESIIAVNEADYLTDARILEKIKQKEVMNLGNGAEINPELILSLQPNLMMTSGISDQKLYQPLIASGIKVVVNADWLETDPLGRAEWLKFVALFYGKEAEAEIKFKEIEGNYLKTKDLAKKAKNRPSIITEIPYKGTWYIPGGKSYAAQLLQDAQTDYHWAKEKSTGSMPLDFEAVYPIASKADFWLNVGIFRSKAEVLAQDSRFADFKAFKTGEIYNNNQRATPKGGNEYYMNGIVTPHLILADLVKIFHPELLPEHQLVYYQKIK